MSTWYRNLPENREVTDVLFAMIVGDNTQKDISKRLKQDQRIVQVKVEFLKRNGVIAKEGWVFQLNEEGLYKHMLTAFNSVLIRYQKIANDSKEAWILYMRDSS